ncbi:hypothetical protein Ahy_B06g080254 isoform B [Arachis hypogaea]|uniref:Uncharacterized protein n=1 Tax=Arachis hypogaea TaxID=3818 RepID=A0A444YHM2_ARAHY|nr:hypothetical protein Ahy_B06g080254 isoform B [Arachis hypogaea]
MEESFLFCVAESLITKLPRVEEDDSASVVHQSYHRLESIGPRYPTSSMFPLNTNYKPRIR